MKAIDIVKNGRRIFWNHFDAVEAKYDFMIFVYKSAYYLLKFKNGRVVEIHKLDKMKEDHRNEKK